MLEDFNVFIEGLQKKTIMISNKKLKRSFDACNFLFISENFNFNENQELSNSFKNTEILIIDYYENVKESTKYIYLIIAFEKSIIVINQSFQSSIKTLFTYKSNPKICFLNNSKEVFDKTIKTEYIELSNNKLFDEGILNCFRFIYTLDTNLELIESFINHIMRCFFYYIFSKSFEKLNQNRFNEYVFNIHKHSPTIIEEDDYISFGTIDGGSSFLIELIYHIEKEVFLVLKKVIYCNYNNYELLIEREKQNYLKIKHPLIPKYYGIVKNEDFYAIDFINGSDLTKIKKMKLNEVDKISIIFELILVFSYLHSLQFVYRDLKPNNIMIDKNKTAVLLDFDRMINLDNIKSDQDFTNDFSSCYVAPEVNSGIISYQNDIYSLGKIIYFIIYEKNMNKDEININSEIDKIIKKCIDNNTKEKPNINDLLKEFVNKFYSQINDKYIYDFMLNKSYQSNEDLQIVRQNCYAKFACIAYIINLNKFIDGLNKIRELIVEQFDANKLIKNLTIEAHQNNPDALCKLGDIYYQNQFGLLNINKAIYFYSLAANQNNPDAMYNLGVIYYDNKYVARDINRAIHYLTLSAEKNQLDACQMLGIIYFNGKYVLRDMSKAIHYLTLASKNNNPTILFILGCVYYEGYYVHFNINKAIHYFLLAAKQNHADSLYNLGDIFSSNNINKAIYYYSLAAKQNHCESLHALGIIYTNDKRIKQDINKAIYYYSIAAKLNYHQSQYNLGKIYEEGLYVKLDINKALYYYTLAAKQNDYKAQNQLGNIYSDGKYIKPDFDKALYYYELAANQNHDQAQYNLGLFYSNSSNKKYYDIKKAIHYYTLASNQNHMWAQYNLGCKYIENNITQAIHYYTLSAKQNCKEAQYQLGIIYLQGEHLKKDIKKAISFLKASSNNSFVKAQFSLGFLFHEGKYIKRDIKESIRLYKEASSLNNQYAKNNLGIIYKNGFKDEISKNFYNAEIYFNEAIKQKNDILAKYNLAHLYFYSDEFENMKDKIIDLLISSINQNFYPSKELLALVLIKSYNFDEDKIVEFFENTIDNEEILSVALIMDETELFNALSYEYNYEYYKNIDFLYDYQKGTIQSNELLIEQKCKEEEKILINDISLEFYEGFGIDL